jgi:hypothetical protein
MDRNGKEVDKANAFGHPIEYVITHPDYFIMVDETGSNTNMKKDGKQGGKRGIAERGFGAEVECSIADCHYTVLPFTAATGDPVMCAVIMKSADSRCPASWIHGIDVMRLNNNATAQLHGVEFYREVTQGDGACAGGPVCTFQGKAVPCFVGSSPHAGITPELLTGMLRILDELDLFPRVDGRRPFLLLDGHWSRFDLDLLKYIRTIENQWSVCFGVPYATHIWQVADSSEQNGSYKIAEAGVKRKIMQKKSELRMDPRLGPTDIIPIVRMAWVRSFAHVQSNKNAIADRGWNPCNRALLTMDEILRTKVNDITGKNALDESRHQDPIVTIPTDLNVETGTAAALFDQMVDRGYTSVAGRERRRQRDEASTVAKKALDKTKRLTSGPAFANGLVALHGDVVFEHQSSYVRGKEVVAEAAKKAKAVKLAKKKKKVDGLLAKKADQSRLTVTDLKTLVAYKRRIDDPPIASAKGNKAVLLGWWQEYKERPSPTVSPAGSDVGDDDDNDDDDIEITEQV